MTTHPIYEQNITKTNTGSRNQIQTQIIREHKKHFFYIAVTKKILLSTAYPNESNNNTTTKHNIINSERVSQLRRSYRTRNSKKGNEIRQQNTITEKYKRDSIQVTTTERRVRHRKGTVCLQRCKDVYCIRLRASLIDFTHLL